MKRFKFFRQCHLLVLIVSMVFTSCELFAGKECKGHLHSKSEVVFQNEIIGPNMGITTGKHILVDGYRYANIFVEFEQEAVNEGALSIGVVFAMGPNGEMASRRYFHFENPIQHPAKPKLITISGENCWQGTPHNKSSYIARFPIMGPYMKIIPYNSHNKARKFSIAVYLSR